MEKYPVFRRGKEIYTDDFFIVRFDSKTDCTVVFSTDEHYPVGRNFQPKASADSSTWEKLRFDYDNGVGFYETQPIVQKHNGVLQISFYKHDFEYSGELFPFDAPKVAPDWIKQAYLENLEKEDPTITSSLSL
jgi:hypothetical protein